MAEYVHQYKVQNNLQTERYNETERDDFINMHTNFKLESEVRFLEDDYGSL